MVEVHVNGLRFHVEDQGAGPPLTLLHGFTGSSRSWDGVSAALRHKQRTVAIDMIGHGASDAPRAADRYAFTRALDDLSCLAAASDVERAPWLGYSMGGRLALGLALRHPERVSMLILESASPGIAAPRERARRRHADESLADRIEQNGVEAFVAEWERLPMWGSQSRLPATTVQRQREIRLGNSAAGLAGSLRGMSTGAQPSFWEELHAIQVPTLIIAGGLDQKFSTIARQMTDAMPRAELVIVPDAGHAVHLEQPDLFVKAISSFLSRS